MNSCLDTKFEEAVPNPKAYYELFESTSWNNDYGASVQELHMAISNSWYTLCAYNGESELVGFGRVVSDGILYAFICDLIVHPAYQNRGIGSTILQKLIQRCKKGKIRVLWLFAAANKTGFYKKLGFRERPLNAPGMQLNLNSEK